MNPPVHILCTVRKPELLPAALLVFRTVRIGFPSSPVYVWGNALNEKACQQIIPAVSGIGGYFTNLKPTCHDGWIENLVLNSPGCFWICDTDVVFFGAMEGAFDGKPDVIFSGRLEPEWLEPWSKTRKVERLHTCLQWHNAAALRKAMLAWSGERVPEVFHTAQVPFIRQTFLPARKETILYDTTAGLWQAGVGTPFTDDQNGKFEHLHAATYADEVGKCAELQDLPELHKAVYLNPESAWGLQVRQNEFYQKQKPD